MSEILGLLFYMLLPMIGHVSGGDVTWELWTYGLIGIVGLMVVILLLRIEKQIKNTMK